MKKNVLFLPAILIMSVLTATANAQTLKLVPNPDDGVGYFGAPIPYNNKLYFTYRDSAGGEELAYYNGNSIIPVPDTISGTLFVAALIVYNNDLYLEIYNRTAGVYQLGIYDGTAITLIPNPDATNPEFNFLCIYDNKLCLQYNSQMATYDGSSWTIFDPPVTGGFTYQGGLTEYKNKLYMGFETNAAPETREMMSFNDTVLAIIPNPDGATAFNPFGGGYQGLPIIYNNYLYTKYVDSAGFTELNQFDGTKETLISNPDTGPGYGYGSGGSPIVYNNKLYIQYLNTNYTTQLAQYDGTALTLVSNPDTGARYGGYQGAPIVYNNNLYFQYQDAASVYRLAKYDGTSVTLIPNPDASPYGWANYTSTGAAITPPIVAPDLNGQQELFIQYENAKTNNQLAQYNDTALTLITNPDTAVNGGSGYVGSPVIYNDSLFIEYTSAASHDYLAYLAPSASFPVTLLNFTAQQQGNNNLLQWQTTSEINSSYFNIQRSTDGKNFIDLGKMSAMGNTSTKHAYNYTDLNADKLGFQLLYYRLQMVDKDGKYTYSSIAPIKLSSPIALSLYPDPAITQATLVFNELTANNYTVKVSDLQGRTVSQLNGTSIAGVNNLSLDVHSYPAGTYIITITDQEHGTQSLKLNKL